jgi:hypothetical protein
MKEKIRKAIQIAYHPNNPSARPTVLCDDGTIWIDMNGKWMLVDDVPQAPLDR